ncbi:hypothetical protein BFP76_13570 [Amylibacter kogurei]|uniref:HTH tetR-type domain-containing protein n=1 Tax=Paramylibacter kogurei TaxID=1889778 RepID=A0A2G5K8Y8_9RHOB|nr:TetR/AcrR family transcriptional regulator [Amylibacter kogurei]PIB26001.1 hypothetical protein BFP76_13570 [Amylibacter kogurei]
MARARNVTHQQAMDAAQDLFWQNGYNAVSTRQIEEQTGLTRFTLQREYGGKKSFFLATLDHYLSTDFTIFLPLPSGQVLPAITQWFENITQREYFKEAQEKGCLLRTAVNEFPRGDQDVDHRIEQYFENLRRCFVDALELGKNRGELKPDLDIQSKVDILIATLIGGAVLRQAGKIDSAHRTLETAIPNMILEWANDKGV